MLASNFAVSACVIPEANGSRSQLVANRFLIELSQVFGWGEFTSRDVSNRFGLDFLNTAKRLSRMAHAGYYLLSARQVSRPNGGYENSYTISKKGWGKISYLQGHPVPAEKPIAGNCPAEAAQYLVKRKGEVHDAEDHLCFELIASKFPSLPYIPRLDEEGLLLFCFDPEVILLEAVNLFQNDRLKTTNRALYLQHRGLIPRDIDVPIFVLNAYGRGSSSSAILISLLFRGATQLRDAYNLSKIASEPDLWDSRRYKDMPEDERRTNRPLKLENDSLQKKLDDANHNARMERLRLNSKIDRLVNLVIGNNQNSLALCQGLEKFEDASPSVIGIKSHVHDSLARMNRLNQVIVTEVRRDST